MSTDVAIRGNQMVETKAGSELDLAVAEAVGYGAIIGELNQPFDSRSLAS